MAERPASRRRTSLFPNSAGTDVRIGTAPPLPVQPAAPVLTLPNTRSFGTADIVNPNLTNGYVQQWNLNIQRQIAKNTILDIGYVANRGVKLFYEVNLNQSHIFNNGFLPAFNQLAANVNNAVGGSVVEPDCRHFRIGFGGDFVHRRKQPDERRGRYGGGDHRPELLYEVHGRRSLRVLPA